MPTDACNDIWNIIPCCTTCNSSKGGKLFNDWIKSKSAKNPFKRMNSSKKNKIINKIQKFDNISINNRYYKSYDKKLMKDAITDLNKALEIFQFRINTIKKSTKHIKGKN